MGNDSELRLVLSKYEVSKTHIVANGVFSILHEIKCWATVHREDGIRRKTAEYETKEMKGRRLHKKNVVTKVPFPFKVFSSHMWLSQLLHSGVVTLFDA